MLPNELITIVDKTAGVPIKRQATKVNKHIAVAATSPTHFRIFKIKSGDLFVDFAFANVTTALNFAEHISKVFGPYFDILDDYPDADIINMAKWSVQNGLKIIETVTKLQEYNTPVTTNDVNNIYVTATGKDWSRT